MQLFPSRRCGSSFLYLFRPVSLVADFVLLILAAYLAGHYAQIKTLVLAGAILSILADATGCFALFHNHHPIRPILGIDFLGLAVLIPGAIFTAPQYNDLGSAGVSAADGGNSSNGPPSGAGGPPPWKNLLMVVGIVSVVTIIHRVMSIGACCVLIIFERRRQNEELKRLGSGSSSQTTTVPAEGPV